MPGGSEMPQAEGPLGWSHGSKPKGMDPAMGLSWGHNRIATRSPMSILNIALLSAIFRGSSCNPGT